MLLFTLSENRLSGQQSGEREGLGSTAASLQALFHKGPGSWLQDGEKPLLEAPSPLGGAIGGPEPDVGLLPVGAPSHISRLFSEKVEVAALGIFSWEDVQVYLTLGRRSLELSQPRVATPPGGACPSRHGSGPSRPLGQAGDGGARSGS